MKRSGFPQQVRRLDQVRSSLSSFRHGRWRLCLAVALAGIACQDSVTKPVELQPTVTLEKAATNSGDLQSDTVLATIKPLRVVVRSDGAAAPGIQVFWLISATGLSETSTTITDASGIASLELTLGPRPLVYSVQATLRKTASGPSVTFAVTATSGRATAIQIMSGANQTDTVTAQLGTAYTVQATDAYGNRVAGVEVDWAVSAGGGSISPPRSVTATDGQATARHTLGPTIGVHEVIASAFGVTTPVMFRATATAATPSKLTMVSGNNQSGQTNTALAADYVVHVTDSYDNPIAGIAIDWTITSGGGVLSSARTVTDVNGSTAIKATLGDASGLHAVTATAPELGGAPSVIFTSTAIAPPPPPPPPPPDPPQPPPPPTPQLASLRVTIETTGADLDDTFLLVVRQCSPDTTCPFKGSQAASSNSTVTLGLLPADYTIFVEQVAPNCTVAQNGKSVTVAVGIIAEVSFNVTCIAKGTIRVTTTTTGVDFPPYFYVQVDGGFADIIGTVGGNAFTVGVGSHVVSLLVPGNCTVTSSNPISVTVTDGATLNVGFSVSCVTNPTLRVTVTATGTNIPASFFVGVDYNYYYTFDFTLTVPANGSASIRVPPGGRHVVFQPPSNCRTTSSPGVPVVQVPMGSTTDVVYVVVCF